MKVLYRNICIIFILGVVSACTQSPALVEKRSGYTKATGNDDFFKNPFKISVKNGDTLYSISKQYGVGIRELIELNNLRPPYLLNHSQVIKLPVAKFHMVQEGDTLYAVSRSYGADLSRLIHVNNLQEPYIIKIGQRLRIPSSTQYYDTYSEADYAENKTSQSNIASVVEKDLIKLKDSSDTPKYILPNEVKPVRMTAQVQLGQDSNVLVPRLRPSSNPRPHLKPGTVVAGNKTSVKYQKASYKASYSDPLRKASGFTWPTRGTVISRFGPKKGGLYNDGINIRASEGTTIVASDNGKVVYAGNELRGYGNLILLKHSNGYVTAYAHANDIFVRKGDIVQKGQKIAAVGNTGHVSVPQLHFSIRKGRKAINPQSYLPKG